ncbi:FecR domain-containing protein, partial [Methylobacterium gnaphalii]
MVQSVPRIAVIVLTVAAGLAFKAELAWAEGGQWRVVKVSGEAWISGDKVQAASASGSDLLRAGASIRTGRNGRVLLSRGAESILVSPNSAIALPAEGKPGMSTVLQQAGTILLDVEKKNVQHFEVETPYLAAVVKGTRFRVSVEGARAKVDVERGRVQVADFKTGESALVLPGQSAKVLVDAAGGLQISGRGTLAPVEQGAPRAARVAPLAIPKTGLGPAPGSAPLRPAVSPNGAGESGGTTSSPGGLIRAENGTLRIGAPIGEVTLDVHSATNGIARSESQNSPSVARRATVWSTGDLNPGTNVGKNKATNSGNPVGAADASLGAAGASRSSTSSTSGSLTSTETPTLTSNGTTSNSGNGNGGGSGAGSNGNGNGVGGNGAGNNGNGNNGNGGGNGAGNNGNGNNGNGG